MHEVDSKLITKIKGMGLDLVFADNISRNGVYIAKKKTIIINSKLLDYENEDFKVAHELAHCIKKHGELVVYYNAICLARMRLEHEANQIAILLEIYLNNYDGEKDELNTFCFMEYYKIEHRFEIRVREATLNYK
ncbi:ImmA/IrrE family metallo-endopeptidase [Vagococcus sp.]|uniref:ImmA/IrrE family metallo-endopeptidase n=1 Tax=Vagococcus sp. TaxID=1933889 RepID=UPI003F9A2550